MSIFYSGPTVKKKMQNVNEQKLYFIITVQSGQGAA